MSAALLPIETCLEASGQVEGVTAQVLGFVSQCWRHEWLDGLVMLKKKQQLFPHQVRNVLNVLRVVLYE